MLGQYPAPAEAEPDKELAHPHVVSGGDRENAVMEQALNGHRRPSAGYLGEGGQIGLGFGKANGSGMLCKEIRNIIVPSEAVLVVARTKKDCKSASVSDPWAHSNASIYLPKMICF